MENRLIELNYEISKAKCSTQLRLNRGYVKHRSKLDAVGLGCRLPPAPRCTTNNLPRISIP